MIGLNDAFSQDPATGADERALSEIVAGIFSDQGLLVKGHGLEHRPQQERMAEEIANCLRGESALLMEAGTGVGKSLAYLLPSVIWSIQEERPVIISSHTISLQEQLEAKDIPLCRKILASDPNLEGFASFRHALLVGKGNYICGARLSQAIETKSELFPTDEQKELERIADWYQQTEYGLVHELSPEVMPEVWDWVNADGSACNSRNCNAESCFYRKAREALRGANLIIVNHSLLFSLLASGHFPRGNTPGILFPLDAVILDEAHTLPGIATDHFGLYLSQYGLRRQLLRLYNPKRKRGRGLLAKYGSAHLCSETERLQQVSEQFFQKLLEDFLSRKDTFRPQKADWTENRLEEPLASLIAGIRKVESRLEEGPGRDEVEGLRKSLQTYREGVSQCLHLSDPDSVYWIERSGGKRPLVRLRSAPLELAPILRERLFDRNTGIALTSATLAEGSEMHSIQERIGAEEADSCIELSPFDFDLQMHICIARDAPAPNIRNQQLDQQYLAEQILFALSRVKGGVLVLFTGYRDMYRIERTLRSQINETGRRLLVQGQDGSRSHLVDEMKRLQNGVLFGTDSFWAGVDLPGIALEQVIMTRLPFENPDHPVIEARSELCREQGGSPFSEITLPAAVVKFRQGIGRLIRKQTDQGIINILDSRILHKPYGQVFLNALPRADHILYSKVNRESLFPQLNA